MSASGQPQIWQRGDKCGTGAHLHIFTHSHMASDAQQPQRSGLQQPHATLSRNTPKLQHLSSAWNSTLMKKSCGQWIRRGTSVFCTRKEKSTLWHIGLWFGVFGFSMVRVRSSAEWETLKRSMWHRGYSPVQSAALTHRRHPAVKSKRPSCRVTHCDLCRTLTNPTEWVHFLLHLWVVSLSEP